jgi:hypothetical protein
LGKNSGHFELQFFQNWNFFDKLLLKIRKKLPNMCLTTFFPGFIEKPPKIVIITFVPGTRHSRGLWSLPPQDPWELQRIR